MIRIKTTVLSNRIDYWFQKARDTLLSATGCLQTMEHKGVKPLDGFLSGGGLGVSSYLTGMFSVSLDEAAALVP